MESPGCSCPVSAPSAASTTWEHQAEVTPNEVMPDDVDPHDKTAAELARVKGKGKLREIQEEPPEAGVASDAAAIEIDDLTCAICLEQMKTADTAIIKGCGHSYCATCILSWKVVKEQAGCPQCKAPFSTLHTYRSLDGSLHDFPQEESVCLLARAHWFAAHLKEAEKGKQAMAEVLGQRPDAGRHGGNGDWNDYSRYMEEFDDDEEVENYYFSAAAGRARIVLGNRRWGENGYVSSGRQHARPRVSQSTGKGGKGKASKAKAAGAASPSTPSQPIPTAASRSAPASAPLPILRNPPGASPGGSAVHAEGASPSTPVGQYMKGRKGQQHSAVGAADAAFGSSPGSECGESGGNGRRARRAAKKAAADARAAAIPGF